MKENALKKGDFMAKKGENIENKGKEAPRKVIRLNISQFELTKILYSSGILAECDLTPSAKLFLWALCSHYNPGNETMFPSQQTVAKKLGISEKSAQRAVKELKTFGLIDYETKRVNHYVFGEKFFELVKMSGAVGQNVWSEGGQNVHLTNKKEKKEKQKDFSSKVFGQSQGARKQGQEQVSAGKMVPNVEETRKMIEENEKIRQEGFNPFEYNRKDALEWLRGTAPFWIQRSKLAEFLVRKYGFKEFQHILKNKGNNENLLENSGKQGIKPVLE